MKIMGCMRYLARQGLAFRGHEVDKGNLYHLVKFMATEDPLLASGLTRYLTLFGNTVVKEIASDIRSLPLSNYLS